MPSDVSAKPRAAERIQEAARGLFERQGIRATGVEEVCRVAGATKMSLYRAYPSKDALVAAILAEDAAEHEAWVEESLAAAKDAEGRLRALIEATAVEVAEPGVCGCPMLLAQAEFRDPCHPTHKVVVDFKQGCRDRIRTLAVEAGAGDPDALADELALVIEGAIAARSYLGEARAAEALRRCGAALIGAALPHRAARR
ncbi:TetR/AcrR family transcriptional regulator [Roseomonas sp. JC162]|uniref:TetR/AcrR family transcriptional regulator n=1 Tax=Neoroseomonas marina TaxID=1232220 RepID=A0A848EJ29_9PROT|nr:TetR/AcrR family transcriptional regulator [Neoroseomonas marina]NMJ43709.1 TetR/AcrR family transcriptional regulator [Neoroseomonas marina]